MAERYRSKHGGRDTDEILAEDDLPAEGGRGGGDLARDVGTRDHLKRSFERPASASRVRGSDTPEDGGKD